MEQPIKKLIFIYYALYGGCKAMVIIPSEKASNVTYAIRNIVAEAKKIEKQGKQILYCNIGDPCKFDFKTPKHIIDAVTDAMIRGENGYAPSQGIEEARIAISEHMASYNKVNVKSDKVFITSGGSEAIELALTALLNPGENVLTPAPGYPLYNAVITKIGGVLNPYYLDDDWNLDIADIKQKINEKTKAIILINPNNPTGKMYSAELLKEVITLAKNHNLVIFSDEIYDKLLFEKEHISIASLCEDVPILTINGMSKSYMVPGWRVGWIAVSNIEENCPYFLTMKRLLDARLCSPAPQQFAIKPALTGPQDHLKEACQKLRERRDFVCERLNNIKGISCVKPDAAFYAMAKLESDRFKTDEEFVLQLLKETGVLFVHGSGFEVKPGSKSFRIVYLPTMETLKDAMDKLESFMN